MHDVVREARFKVRSVHCEFRLQLFHTRERLMNHVDKSTKCSLLYKMVVPDLNDDDRLGHEEQAKADMLAITSKGFTRHKAVQPAVRLQGPLLKVSELVEIRHGGLLRGPALKFD